MSDAVDRLRDALDAHGCRITGAGQQFTAQCPAHEDSNPSLSVSAAHHHDGAVVNCHAGCSTADIVAALGLTMADLFDAPIVRAADRAPGAGRSVEVARYPYVDEDGTVLYFKIRSAPKHFRQARPGPDGSLVWSLGTVRRVLYRLPDVRTASRAKTEVYVLEGEKDADAMAARGVTATTWTDGAWKPGERARWRSQYTGQLCGASLVTIVADDDTTGRHTAAEIARTLTAEGIPVRVVLPAAGKDASDHLAAGHGIEDFLAFTPDATPDAAPDSPAAAAGTGAAAAGRRVELTRASAITIRAVSWLWAGRIAIGTLALLAGREGLGKSALGYWLLAQITNGLLPGAFLGVPKSVLVAATEDSWAHTVVPRLMAAGADLDRVYRVEAVTDQGTPVGLTLPVDLPALAEHARDVDAVLLVLDPLLSRLDSSLDSHKDAEVRLALEPLVAMADEAGIAVVGLIHHNKSGGSDPLDLVMASKAFTAVARSVHSVVRDPDDDTEGRRLFGTPKNNLGRADLPTLAFHIEGTTVPGPDGPIGTARFVWDGEIAGSIRDALEAGRGTTGDRSALTEAAEWLEDYLVHGGGHAHSSDIKAAGRRVGHSEDALKRAAKKLRVEITSGGFPRRTTWTWSVTGGSSTTKAVLQSAAPQSAAPVGASPRGDTPTALTDSQVLRLSTSAPVGAVSAVGAPPQDDLLPLSPDTTSTTVLPQARAHPDPIDYALAFRGYDR